MVFGNFSPGSWSNFWMNFSPPKLLPSRHICDFLVRILKILDFTDIFIVRQNDLRCSSIYSHAFFSGKPLVFRAEFFTRSATRLLIMHLIFISQYLQNCACGGAFKMIITTIIISKFGTEITNNSIWISRRTVANNSINPYIFGEIYRQDEYSGRNKIVILGHVTGVWLQKATKLHNFCVFTFFATRGTKY